MEVAISSADEVDGRHREEHRSIADIPKLAKQRCMCAVRLDSFPRWYAQVFVPVSRLFIWARAKHARSGNPRCQGPSGSALTRSGVGPLPDR